MCVFIKQSHFPSLTQSQGCLLYKLCFFTTPFGEQPLALLSRSFCVTDNSHYSDQMHQLLSELGGGGGGVRCKVCPPPPPPGYMLEVDSKETPCSMYTCVAVLDHNHTAWDAHCVVDYSHLVKLLSKQV